MRRHVWAVAAIIILPILVMLPHPVEASPSPVDWVMVVFMAGDNGGLADQIPEDVGEIVDSNSPVDVFVLTDGNTNTDGAYYHIKNGTKTELPDLIYEPDMGSVGTYKTILKDVFARVTPSHLAIVFWDHGFGYGGVCYDFNTPSGANFLTNSEIEEILAYAQFLLGHDVDVVGFDACYMGQVDVIYAVQPYAKYFVGSETTEPWQGWYYGFLSSVDNTTTPEEFAKAVCTNYDYYYSTLFPSAHPDLPQPDTYTMSAINLTNFAILTDAMNMLFQSLKHDMANEMNTIINAISATPTFLSQSQLHFHDLNGFANHLLVNSPNQTVRFWANATITNISTAVAQFNGTIGTGISFYWALGVNEYNPSFATEQICLDTQYDEAQIAFFRQHSTTPTSPSPPSPSVVGTTLYVNGTGAQYRLGKGRWLSYYSKLTIPGNYTIYYRSFDGNDYSEVKTITINNTITAIQPIGGYISTTITFYRGWNIFSPFVDNLTAEGLCALLGLNNTKIVSRQTDGTYIAYIQGSSRDDFPLQRGHAYYVWVEANVSVPLSAELPSTQKIYLSEGWNLIGVYVNRPLLASSFNATGIKYVVKRDPNGEYVFYNPSAGTGHDFSVKIGDGLYIYATKQTEVVI